MVVAGGWGEWDGESAFDRVSVSVWEDEVLDVDGGGGCATTRMCSVPLAEPGLCPRPRLSPLAPASRPSLVLPPKAPHLGGRRGEAGAAGYRWLRPMAPRAGLTQGARLGPPLGTPRPGHLLARAGTAPAPSPPSFRPSSVVSPLIQGPSPVLPSAPRPRLPLAPPPGVINIRAPRGAAAHSQLAAGQVLGRLGPGAESGCPGGNGGRAPQRRPLLRPPPTPPARSAAGAERSGTGAGFADGPASW